MSDHQPSIFKFFGFCAVFMTIVLFCVAAGGYSSFTRSKNRIEKSKSFLTDACQERLELIPELISIANKTVEQSSMDRVNQLAEQAEKSLNTVISQKTPLAKDVITKFESTQTTLTDQLKTVFLQMESLPDKNQKQQFKTWKNKLYLAQNNLFVTKRKYNNEVAYFNARKSTFPPLLLAKLFGFDKLIYIEISQDVFLPAGETFEKKT